jgi:hypothetical protein
LEGRHQHFSSSEHGKASKKLCNDLEPGKASRKLNNDLVPGKACWKPNADLEHGQIVRNLCLTKQSKFSQAASAKILRELVDSGRNGFVNYRDPEVGQKLCNKRSLDGLFQGVSQEGMGQGDHTLESCEAEQQALLLYQCPRTR